MKNKWPAPYPGAYWLDQREDRAVMNVLHQRALFRYYGMRKPKHVEALEARARAFYGVQYALGVNSGTGALFTAVTALGIGPGCEVIVPAFCWVATVGAVVSANAIPVPPVPSDVPVISPVSALMLIQLGFCASENFRGSIFQNLAPGFGLAASLLVRSPRERMALT